MNYGAAILEIFTAILGVFLLVLGLIVPKDRKSAVGVVSIIGLSAILVYSFFTGADGRSFYNGVFVADSMALFFKQLFLATAILVTAMSLNYVNKLTDSRSEFFTLTVFALLGAMVMVSSNDFITLFIGLELMTISFIILTAFDKMTPKSTEAGVKYILLSALSSAVLLYGMSLLYGLSGSVVFGDVLAALKQAGTQPMAILAVILLIAAFGFKISAVPFHMWSPDIYEGAPAPVTAFLAAGSKAAGMAVLIRLFVEGIAPTYSTLWIIIMLMAALSMLLGNITAIPQTNIKRMLAFSSISQAGYILLGLVAFTQTSVSAMLYYLVLYVFANTGAFAAVTAFTNQTGEEDIASFAGMWKRSPFLSAVLLVSLLSMAGIPPAAGFVGKFYLFSETIRQGYLWLALFAIAMSVVSIYYYIGVIRTMLVRDAVSDQAVKIPVSSGFVMGISMAATLLLGIVPGPVTEWTLQVVSQFMH